jgi:hypothetical protein
MMGKRAKNVQSIMNGGYDIQMQSCHQNAPSMIRGMAFRYRGTISIVPFERADISLHFSMIYFVESRSLTFVVSMGRKGINQNLDFMSMPRLSFVQRSYCSYTVS